MPRSGDPFHVVRLAGDALDRRRRRVQQDLHGHRGLRNDPLYRARRTLHTGEDLLTDRQRERLMVLFTNPDHVQVEATWGILQRMIAAYRHPDRASGREAMAAVIDSLARWAFPDLWGAFAGSWPTAVAVLTRWPDLRTLAGARRSSVTAVVAEHTRGVASVAERAGAIRAAAASWVDFWGDRLDLDALAWETAEHLRDITIAGEQIARATTQAHHYWAALYGDDPLLLSLPGMGPMTAPTIRAFLGDATGFATAKAAASYVGLAPSTWSSGTLVQPSRAITKEGPAVLRLAFYQATNGARRVDPQLAAYYRHLMVERGHCHTQATVAVARKLVERTWTVLRRGQPYQYRDVAGAGVTRLVAKTQARTDHQVPEPVRARARARSAATHRAKLTR